MTAEIAYKRPIPELEQWLCGCVLIDPRVLTLPDVLSVTPEHMQGKRRQHLWAVYRDLAQDDRLASYTSATPPADTPGPLHEDIPEPRKVVAADLGAILAALRERTEWPHGWVAELLTWASQVAWAEQAPYIARQLLEEHRIRQVETARAEHMQQAVSSDTAVPAADRYRDVVHDVMASRPGELIGSIVDSAKRMHARLTSIWDGTGERTVMPFRSVPEINEALCGLHRGYVTVIAARPACGKSSLMEQEAVAQAEAGVGVMIVPLELDQDDHVTRIAIRDSRCHLTLEQIEQVPPSDQRMRRFLASYAEIPGLPIRFCNPTPGRDVDSMLALMTETLRRYAEDSIQLVCIDYFTKLSWTGDHFSAHHGYAEVSEKIRVWAKRQRVAVLLLSQMNRKVENSNREPQMSDLRETGSLEEDAAHVCFLHRRDGQTDFCIKKNRFGGVGKVSLRFIGSELRFEATPDVTFTHGREESYRWE